MYKLIEIYTVKQGNVRKRVQYTWKIGPGNLISAIHQLDRHRLLLKEVGEGGSKSWLAIKGKEVPDSDLRAILQEKDRFDRWVKAWDVLHKWGGVKIHE